MGKLARTIPVVAPAVTGVLMLGGVLAMPLSSEAKTVVATASGFEDTAIVSATATCPKGQRAVGGGFATSPPISSTPSGPPRTEPISHLAFIQVYASLKVGQDRWRVSGQITDRGGTSASRTLEAYAYCKTKAPKTREVSVTSASGGGTYAGQLYAWGTQARCPKAKQPVATAGGFQTEPPYPVLGSYSAPRSTVGESVLEDKNGEPYIGPRVYHRIAVFTAIPGTTYTSFVYCKDKGAIGAKIGARDAEGQGTQITAFSGECKKKKRKANAGGFLQPNHSLSFTGPNAPKGYYEPIIGSLRIAKQWWVTALHNGAASTQLESFAYCS